MREAAANEIVDVVKAATITVPVTALAPDGDRSDGAEREVAVLRIAPTHPIELHVRVVLAERDRQQRRAAGARWRDLRELLYTGLIGLLVVTAALTLLGVISGPSLVAAALLIVITVSGALLIHRSM